MDMGTDKEEQWHHPLNNNNFLMVCCPIWHTSELRHNYSSSTYHRVLLNYVILNRDTGHYSYRESNVYGIEEWTAYVIWIRLI